MSRTSTPAMLKCAQVGPPYQNFPVPPWQVEHVREPCELANYSGGGDGGKGSSNSLPHPPVPESRACSGSSDIFYLLWTE